jgi:hypothetical protein
MLRPYRSYAVPLPRRAALIHTCHAAPQPFPDSAVSFVKVRVVAGRSRTRAGRPHSVSGRPMLIHTCHAHAALCRGLEKSLLERDGRGMTRTWHGRDMECVNQTRLRCVKMQSKPLAERHGRAMGTASYG